MHSDQKLYGGNMVRGQKRSSATRILWNLVFKISGGAKGVGKRDSTRKTLGIERPLVGLGEER